MAEDAKPVRLSADGCRQQAEQCRRMAETAKVPAHQTMLQHMAATWERLAGDVEDPD